MKTTLQKIFAVSLLTFLLSLVVFLSNAQTTQIFTGSGSWVCPYGVTSITVETWGGGGAGGAAPTTSSVGAGGGGGAYKITSLISVTFGISYNYVVGVGGAGNVSGAGGSGTASSFNGLYTANFGTGGGFGPVIGTSGVGGTGGTYNGGNGGSGILTGSGGGGGGAGSTGNGGNGANPTAGIAGGTDGGAGGAGQTTTSNGSIGITVGGGGSGALKTSGKTGNSGGNGAAGQIRLTYTINCTAPPAQPTALILTPGLNNIAGTFTAAAYADGYLVIRTTTAAAPTAPVDGITYTAGTSALGGFIESVGSTTSFNSISLVGTTQYWYWAYGYDNVSCVGGIKYLTASPLTGNAATVACGMPLNRAIITTPGTNNYNFSTLSWSLGHVPTSCESAEIVLNISTATAPDITTILWDVNFTCFNMTLTNSSSDPYVHIFQTNGTSTINILGDLFMRSPGANRFNRSVFSNQTVTTINGNLILGNPVQGALDGHAAIGSNGATPDQTYILKGNMTFNPRGYTTDEWTKFVFDKAGTQIITNNTVVSDTTQPVLFEKLIIGNTNASTVIFAGTTPDGYIENVRAAGVTIGVNSTLDLPANYSLTKFSAGFAEPIIMLAGAKLRLGGDKTIDVSGIVSTVISGSNFPTNFSPYTFDPTSTVEYYGSNGLTQTIYNGVTYANLAATNGSGSGRAVKQTTAGTLTVNTSFNINALADVYLGTSTGLGTSTAPVTSAGPLNINATGGLYCNANVVSGAGAFTMGNSSYLGMGHPQGISLLGNAMGNIQMTSSRTYNTTGNYIYNGLVTQITGGGLPTTVNDLTIDNPTTVTIATNQLVNGVDLLKQGIFDIGSTKITHNGTGTLISVSPTAKMKANLGIVEMKGTSGVAQNLSGSWFVNKTISSLINSNTIGITVAATPADTLLISSALLYGATNSIINTNSNLTLLSRDTATARFGPLGIGNDITGQVIIERYMPAVKSWRLLAAPVANASSPLVSASWREGVTSPSGYGTRITGPASFVGVDEITQRASMKYYDGLTNKYIDVNNTNTTKIGNINTGYYVFVRGDRSVAVNGTAAATILRIKGDIQKGTQVVNVLAGKFATLANPYPSGINLITTVKSNISNTYYAWNPNSLGSYNVGAFENYTFNGTNYLKVPGGTIRNTIQSGEAIFIQSNGAAGSVTINETDKVGGITTPVSRPSSTTARVGINNPTLEINMYTRDVDGSTYLADGVLMNFDDNYSAKMDNDDIRKISNAGDNFAIKNDANLLIVERRPYPTVADTIKFNLANTRINPYRFEIDPSVLNDIGLEAILKDKFLGSEIVVSLSNITNYNFNITADAESRAADRFMIVFNKLHPMRFVQINAVRNKNNTVSINWYTENENDINTYTIEYSKDGINFNEIGSQMPTANNKGNPHYNFIHNTPVDENNWYQIKANTIGGLQLKSDLAKIVTKETVLPAATTVYPNPVIEGNVHISFANNALGKYQITITNMAGQRIYTESLVLKNSDLQKTISLGSAATGNYQLIVKDDIGNSKKISFVIK